MNVTQILNLTEIIISITIVTCYNGNQAGSRIVQYIYIYIYIYKARERESDENQ